MNKNKHVAELDPVLSQSISTEGRGRSHTRTIIAWIHQIAWKTVDSNGQASNTEVDLTLWTESPRLTVRSCYFSQKL